MSSVKNAVIAAAGLGSRLGLGMPKCMIPINKAPILARMINTLSEYVETIVIVVGYREEMILEYCQNNFRNVIIARNPDFLTTNTAHSLSIGASFISGKTMFLDGDLLLERQSLGKIFELAEDEELVLGITHAKTDQPVYVDCSDHCENSLVLKGFSREERAPYEWANLFIGPPNIMNGAQRYVFEKLAGSLPARAALIDVEEIDTPQDLERAELVVRSWKA